MAGVDRDLGRLARLHVPATRVHSGGHGLAADVEVSEDLASHALDHLDLGRHFGQAIAAREPRVLQVFRANSHDDLLPALGAGLRKEALLDRDIEALAVKRGLAVAPDPDREEVHGRAPDEAGDEHIDRVMVEGVGRVHLLDITIFHDDDPVTHGHGLHLLVAYIYK